MVSFMQCYFFLNHNVFYEWMMALRWNFKWSFGKVCFDWKIKPLQLLSNTAWAGIISVTFGENFCFMRDRLPSRGMEVKFPSFDPSNDSCCTLIPGPGMKRSSTTQHGVLQQLNKNYYWYFTQQMNCYGFKYISIISLYYQGWKWSMISNRINNKHYCSQMLSRRM